MRKELENEMRGKAQEGGSGAGRVFCRLELSFSNPEEAETVFRSVRQEDEGYIKSMLNGSTLEAEAEAESIPSILHTINDYLVCISTAKKLIPQHSDPIQPHPEP